MFKVYLMAINMSLHKKDKGKEVFATQQIQQKSKAEGPLDDYLIVNNLFQAKYYQKSISALNIYLSPQLRKFFNELIHQRFSFARVDCELFFE